MALNYYGTMALNYYGTMALNHLGTMAPNLRLDSVKVVNELMALWRSNLI